MRLPHLSTVRILLACAAFLVAILPALSVSSAAPSTAPPVPGSYYLALGDSLAVGVGASGVPADPGCTSPTATGYVCVFYRYLKLINPNLQLRNFGESGADSCVFLNGKGPDSPCTDSLISGTAPSQVAEAVAFIQSHPGQVSPITIDIGGDDLAALLMSSLSSPLAAVGAAQQVLPAIQSNLAVALSQLRAVDPNGEIIVINQYNPIGGIGSPPLPPAIGTDVNDALNNLARGDQTEAAKYGALYVDVKAAFDKYPGGATALTYLIPSLASADISRLNPHPTPAGYALYANTVIDASGYVAPLTLRAHLGKKAVRRHKVEAVTGRSVPFAALRLTVRLPNGRKKTIHGAVDEFGQLALRFKVGKRRGPATARLCASNATGRHLCRKPMRFLVK